MLPESAARPVRRLRRWSIRQELSMRVAAWGSRLVGVGGLLLAVVSGVQAFRDHANAPGYILQVLAGLVLYGVGVYIGGQVLTAQNHASVMANIRTVAIFDVVGLGITVLAWLTDSEVDLGDFNPDGTPRTVNFAATLVDPVEAAALLGVPTVKATGMNITTSHVSTTRLRSVDARGRTTLPALAISVVQGERVALGRGQLRREGSVIPGIGDAAWLGGSSVSVRRGDTLVRIALQGYRGDGGPLLTRLAASADRRLTEGLPAPIA